jgi:biopolymer transport protein ExbB
MHFPVDTDLWVRVLTLLPIFICSTVGLALALAKWMQLRRARSGERVLLQAAAILRSGEHRRAVAVARADRSPIARLIERGIEAAGQPARRVTEHIEQSGRDIARQLEYGLGGLALIATLGPLLGLFGTVVGIIVVFERLAGSDGLVSARQLAGGIGTALYTTMAGLIVGMCALVAHRVLSASVDRVIARLEAAGLELSRLLGGDAP